MKGEEIARQKPLHKPIQDPFALTLSRSRVLYGGRTDRRTKARHAEHLVKTLTRMAKKQVMLKKQEVEFKLRPLDFRPT
jgi:predicted GIY-YIG superfamily endonuclease